MIKELESALAWADHKKAAVVPAHVLAAAVRSLQAELAEWKGSAQSANADAGIYHGKYDAAMVELADMTTAKNSWKHDAMKLSSQLAASERARLKAEAGVEDMKLACGCGADALKTQRERAEKAKAGAAVMREALERLRRITSAYPNAPWDFMTQTIDAALSLPAEKEGKL